MSDATRAYYAYEQEKNRLGAILEKRRALLDESDALLLEADVQRRRVEAAMKRFQEHARVERTAALTNVARDS